jgi:predicted DsbA family dithiol-disulfide isomerase
MRDTRRLTKSSSHECNTRMRVNRILSFLALTTTLTTPTPSRASPAQSAVKAMATVDGETIAESQVLSTARSDLAKLDANPPQPKTAYDRARLQILWKALDGIIEDKLIAAEAAKQRTTRDHLLESEVESNVETPSDGEVDAFYEANKAQIPGVKAQVLPQVRQYMIDASRRRYRTMLVENLRRSHRVVTYLDPLRTEIATAGYPARGPANAPVTIVEFADFECPYCGGLYPTLKQVESNYNGKVRLIYRQFPLVNSHPHAQKAAEASLCAQEQGRFWEFYDSLFSRQHELEVPQLKARAATLKMDQAAFDSCLDSGRQAAPIKKDQDDARKSGVSSTPTIFINGRLISGNRPYADLRAIIDDELQRAGVKR